jgi:hypothetical protein
MDYNLIPRNQCIDKVDPMRVSGNHWQTGSQPGLSLKTPSCILFDPTEKFHSFGGDAEDKYAELAQEDQHMWSVVFSSLLHH